MSPKILRRCTICGNFHASYLVEDPALGKCYLCYKCWKDRQTSQPPPVSAPGEKPLEVPEQIDKEIREERVRVGRKD